MRCGHPLYHFKGESTEYVFGDGEKIHDYESAYSDDCSFVELIHNIIEYEIGDKDYADKILVILAHKLGVEDKLRLTKSGNLKKLTSKEYDKLEEDKIKKLKQSCKDCPEYKPHSVNEKCAGCDQWERRTMMVFSR